MYRTKLFEYLVTLSEDEWQSYDLYAKKTLPQESHLSKLLGHIINHQGNLSHSHLEITYIREHLFPLKSRKSVLNLFSELTAHLKLFFIDLERKKTPYWDDMLLLQSLNNRGLFAEANKHHKRTKEGLTSRPIGILSPLYTQLINHVHYFSENPIKYDSEGSTIFQELIDDTTQHFKNTRSLYSLERQNMIRLDHFAPDKIRDEFTIDKEAKNEIEIIIYHSEQMGIHNNTESAQFLKKFLTENHSRLSEVIRLIIYILLRMYYARAVNNGEISKAQDLFLLHRMVVNNEYFDYKGQVDYNRFLPLIELACFLGEIEWSEKIIDRYKDKINFKDKKIVLSICEALVSFSNKQYQECVNMLNQIYTSNVSLKNRINRLSILCYVEIHKENKAFQLEKLKIYNLYNRRNKKGMSKRIYEGGVNFSKAITMMVKSKDVISIESFIKNTQPIFYKLYLFQKLEKRKEQG